MISYQDFLLSKVAFAPETGFEISKDKINPALKPHQRDIVERLINRYSNPGDVVLDPFGGLMTVPLVAVQKERFGIGIELSCDYFRDGVGYLQTAEMQRGEPTLFDFIEQEGA